MTIPNPVAEALRAEILKLATDGDPKIENSLTPEVLLRIQRVAKTGRDLLMSITVSPSSLAQMIKRPSSPYMSLSGMGQSDDEGLGDTGYSPSLPFAGAAPAENFGMTAIREMIAVAKSLNGNTSPSKLVEALAIAREKGLDDVEKELEEQLWRSIYRQGRAREADPGTKA